MQASAAEEIEVNVKNGEKVEDDEFLTMMRKHFEAACENEEENRRTAEEDIRFRNGDQWTDIAKKNRRNKPCIVSNHTNQFIYQVVNEIRQSRPAIKVQPVDDKADIKTAEIIQGIVRHIEYQSNAAVAYDTAAEQAIDGGFGYFRIHADYTDDNTFEQDLFIKRIANRFSVYFDASCTEPDNSDAMWAFVIEEVKRSDFIDMWPDSEIASWSEGTETKQYKDWINKETVRVAEYFCVKHVEKINLLLNDGSTRWEDDESPIPEGSVVVQQRKVKRREVHWYKTNGAEILEKGLWPGRYIPIIPIFGNEHWIDGKRVLYGITRNLKDPQRLRNYWVSIEAEFLQKTSKAPYIGAKGVFAGVERQWAEANNSDAPYLEFNQTDTKGNPAAAPQRVGFPIPPSGIMAASQGTIDDMKAVTGMYQNSLGATGNETSGKAIIARQAQGNTATYHYTDNVSRGIRFCGIQLVDLIPHYYDSARTARVMGEDGSVKTVKINQPFQDNRGKTKIYNLTVGKYDVVVSSGPSYNTKREQAADSQMQFLQAYPLAAPIIGHKIAANMDWPGAQEISALLKAALPPEIRAVEDAGDDESAEVFQVKQQAEQTIQQISQQAEAQLSEAAKSIQDSQAQIQKLTMDLQAIKADKELEAQKVQVDYKLKNKEIENKRREIELKENEFLLKEAETMGRLNFDKDVLTKEKDVELEKTRLETDTQLAIASAQAEIESERIQNEADEKAALSQIANAQSQTITALENIKDILSKPRRIIRAPDGTVQGIE